MNKTKKSTSKKAKRSASNHLGDQKPPAAGKVKLFRWLKKALVGKSQTQSLDLLDQWILKKKAMSLLF